MLLRDSFVYNFTPGVHTQDDVVSIHGDCDDSPLDFISPSTKTDVALFDEFVSPFCIFCFQGEKMERDVYMRIETC